MNLEQYLSAGLLRILHGFGRGRILRERWWELSLLHHAAGAAVDAGDRENARR